MNIDELNGILTAYLLRIGKSRLKEATLITSKITKGHKDHDHLTYKSNEEEDQFLRTLKRGYGKYKCKLPSKYFNYGRIIYFSSKCPHEKLEDSDDEEEYKDIRKYYRRKRKRYLRKKIILL